uniref:Uncharacterized protein n=1 Tax=Ceratitis capitata TaxID=7213 RepID=W8BS52_CERCA
MMMSLEKGTVTKNMVMPITRSERRKSTAPAAHNVFKQLESCSAHASARQQVVVKRAAYKGTPIASTASSRLRTTEITTTRQIYNATPTGNFNGFQPNADMYQI